MSISFQKAGLWTIIAISIFSIFYWLFGLGIPDAALQFSLGTTFLIMAGLVSGRYVSRLWFKSSNYSQNIVLIALGVLIIIGCFALGLLINKMILNTEFIYFFLAVIILYLVNVFLGSGVGLIRYRIRTRILTAQHALEHTKSELQALQAQISPHFLFNTLNNLYGLSITDHKRVPPLILKLSELLRYSIYDAKELFVALKDEVDYLKNYIEFEKIRLGERLDLKVNLEDVQDLSIKIPPILLIVFLENAFKHSKDNHDNKIFIEITLKVQEDAILFSVKNSCNKPLYKSEINKKNSGFGLASVQKRLDLLYLKKHNLRIQETEKTYEVTLTLPKNEN